MKVVFHLSTSDEDRVVKCLSNVENFLDARPAATINVVVNASGVKAFTKAASYTDRIEPLLDEGVRCKLCRNSLDGYDLTREQLVDDIELVDSGVVELARLQENGYAYITP